jgi:8-oxo-dGTP pyrophosphatase MutT (NUDIX family)
VHLDSAAPDCENCKGSGVCPTCGGSGVCQDSPSGDIQTLFVTIVRFWPGMITPAMVAGIAATFNDPSDGESLKSLGLTLMLLAQTSAPFSRHQFTPGHITCTGFVLAPDGERVLLVHHRRLDRWLLPGGHVEVEDAEIWDAARREVVEETGALLGGDSHPLLAGVDVHGIPARRSEPYHLHHDLVFHFRALSEECRMSHEARAIAWCAPPEFDRYDVPSNVRRAYARLCR